MELWDDVCKYNRRTDNTTLCTSLTALLIDLHLVKDNLTAKVRDLTKVSWVSIGEFLHRQKLFENSTGDT